MQASLAIRPCAGCGVADPEGSASTPSSCAVTGTWVNAASSAVAKGGRCATMVATSDTGPSAASAWDAAPATPSPLAAERATLCAPAAAPPTNVGCTANSCMSAGCCVTNFASAGRWRNGCMNAGNSESVPCAGQSVATVSHNPHLLGCGLLGCSDHSHAVRARLPHSCKVRRQVLVNARYSGR